MKNKIQIQKRKYRIWVKKLRNHTFKLSLIRCVLADLVRATLHNYICMSWNPLLLPDIYSQANEKDAETLRALKIRIRSRYKTRHGGTSLLFSSAEA